jgi:catechol 2,3-dioxygenase-like lactoylglutathione lyase family enzyme
MNQSDAQFETRDRSNTVCEERYLSRRSFLGSLAAATFIPQSFAQLPAHPAIPLSGINHMTINVSDPVRSLEWYQGLFGMPIVARQAGTVILRVGDGPQLLAISGSASSRPRINHLCLSTDNFDADRIVRILGDHGVVSSRTAGPMQGRIRMRGEKNGGAPEGTPELYFGDPDGIVVQIQDSRYCGGAGLLGDECPEEPEPPRRKGLLTVRDYNHFTIRVTDQQRSVAFYKQLFDLPIDTYQGSMPLLRVGTGNQFLAFFGVGGSASNSIIHHTCLTVDNFDPNRILGMLENYGVTPRGDQPGPVGPLKSYVTMRMPNRGGAPGGTPELYFTDPDGILLQIQDVSYCGGNGYLGNKRGISQ